MPAAAAWAPGGAERSPRAGRGSAAGAGRALALGPARAGGADAGRITAYFPAQVFKVRDRKNKQNLGETRPEIVVSIETLSEVGVARRLGRWG